MQAKAVMSLGEMRLCRYTTLQAAIAHQKRASWAHQNAVRHMSRGFTGLARGAQKEADAMAHGARICLDVVLGYDFAIALRLNADVAAVAGGVR